MPDRATRRPWRRLTGGDFALLASPLMLAGAVVLLLLQRAPGVAWPLLVCGLALLSIVIGTRRREGR